MLRPVISTKTAWPLRAVVAVSVLGFLLPCTMAFGLEARFVASLDEGPLAPTSLVVSEMGIAALEPYTGQLELFTADGVQTAKVRISREARGLARLGDQTYLYCDRDASTVVRVDIADGRQEIWLTDAIEPVDLIVAGPECFVLDAGSRRILVCDLSGEITAVVALPVPADQPAGWLADLAWDPLREIFYVFDQTSSGILAYRRDGGYLGGFGSFGNNDGEVTRGGQIACDAGGWIYVTDRYQGRVVVFDDSWTFAGNVDPLDLGGPPLVVPTGLALDASGFLYVASTEGSAIQVYHVEKGSSSVGELLARPLSPAVGDSLSVAHLSFAMSVQAPANLASSVVVDFRIVELPDTTTIVAEAVGLPLVDGLIIGDIVVGSLVWEPDVDLVPDVEFGWQARTRAGAVSGQWMALRSFVTVPLPARFRLEQNFPNPFNPRTTVFLELKGGQEAGLSIYDIRGRLVWQRNLAGLGPGSHKVVWDGIDVSGARMSSGVYFYRLVEGNSSATRKMVLMK